MSADTSRTMTSLHIRPELILGLVLVCLTLSVYVHVREFDFCNYDDDAYVYKNAWVRSGLTAKGITWAFTDMHASNWHPLTWLSHMADCELYGMNAGNHHLTSVILHVLSTLLLFSAFCRMTGMRWESFFLAAVFSLHPLHVESVAWIAERKDVLSTFFMLLALNSYARYGAEPGRMRYLMVLGFFICSLLSKPMTVTFPVLLLLLDYWPLNRLGSDTARQKSAALALLWEKAPFFICSGLATAIAFVAQLKGGAVATLTDAPLQLRLANALVSYCAYVRDMAAPLRLAVMYPFPGDLPVAWTALCAAALMAVTLWALRERRRQPWLAVGWLWYLVSLLPVIGIIKIGAQARADRYSYIPLVGIGIAAIWALAYFLKRFRRGMALGLLGGAAVLAGLMALSYRQVLYWRSSTSLFEHTLAVTDNNFIAHNNLALALTEKGDVAAAISQCRLALAINPRCEETYVNLGLAFSQLRDWPQAVQNYRKALELKPGFATAHNNLGFALAQQGSTAEAVEQYTLAIQNDPEYAEAQNNLGTLLLAMNRPAEARERFLAALRINPAYAEAYNNLGNALTVLQNIDAAVLAYRSAARLLPDNPDIYCNLGNAYALKGMMTEAIACFKIALQLNPASENARKKLELAVQLQNAPASR